MAEFMLVLHDDPAAFAEASPEDIQKVIAEYVAWREALEERGLLVEGRKLKDEGGRVLSRSGGEVRVVDGPYAEAKEVLGGYFIVQADDYDAAVALARECPHLAYGPRIELRQIDPV